MSRLTRKQLLKTVLDVVKANRFKVICEAAGVLPKGKIKGADLIEQIAQKQSVSLDALVTGLTVFEIKSVLGTLKLPIKGNKSELIAGLVSATSSVATKTVEKQVPCVEAFSKSIQLSPEQQKVVNHRGSDLQVIACAGSGKTESISRRIAALITEGVKPEAIIAFTFTEKAAAELKERVTARVAESMGREFLDKLGPLFVGTIHGYCFRMLQESVPEYGNWDVLDEHQHTGWLAREKRTLDLESLPAGRGQWDKIGLWKGTADVLGNELLDIKTLKGAVGATASTYEERLRHFRLLTFGNIIKLAVQELEKPEVHARVTAPLRHLLVDEYQDINPAQERLIELLSSPKSVELTVVGDDDQAIYQWRGSDVRNILEFVKRRKQLKRKVETVTLAENRRCRPEIVEAANRLALTIDVRLEKEIKATRESMGTSVCLWSTDTVEDETSRIAETMQDLYRKGFAWRDMAVLYRSVKTSAPGLIDALKERSIPCSSGGRSGLFANQEAHLFAQIYAWFSDWKWKENRYSPEEIEVDPAHLAQGFAQCFPEGIGAKDLEAYLVDWKKCALQGNRKVSLVGDYYRLLRQLGVHRINPDDPGAAARLGMLGRFSAILADYETINLRGCSEDGTFHEAKSKGKWFYLALANYLMHYARDAYEDFEGEEASDLDAVQILTIHQAKGLEWPIVFLPGLVQGRFPSSKTGQSRPWLLGDDVLPLRVKERYQGSIEDEKRLFYVALTRAREMAFLSYFERKKNRFQPSVFLEPLGLKPVAESSLPLPKVESSKPREAPLLSVSFSETAQWSDCGLRYRFSKSLGFLPPLNEAMGYGKALHHLLRLVAEERLATGDIPDWEACEELVRKDFFVPYADHFSFQRMQASAKRLLKSYWQNHQDDLARIWATERAFELHTTEGIVTGRADVILDREDGRPDRLAIVDYKTTQGTDNLHDRYEEQLRIYAAVGRGEGLEVSAAWLHSLKDGSRQPVDIAASLAEESMTKVRSALRGIRKGEFAAKPTATGCEGCDYNRICYQCHPRVSHSFEE